LTRSETDEEEEEELFQLELNELLDQLVHKQSTYEGKELVIIL